jgi:hypothetical protein
MDLYLNSHFMLDVAKTDFRLVISQSIGMCIPMDVSDLGNRRTDFDESWYERYGIGDIKFARLHFL